MSRRDYALKVQGITARQCRDVFRTVQHILERAWPAATRIADPAVLDAPGSRACAGQRREKMSGVIQIVRCSPEPAVNENDDGMRPRSRGQAEIAELQRILAVGNPRIGFWRCECQDLLTRQGRGRACAKKYSSRHRN